MCDRCFLDKLGLDRIVKASITLDASTLESITPSNLLAQNQISSVVERNTYCNDPSAESKSLDFETT